MKEGGEGHAPSYELMTDKIAKIGSVEMRLAYYIAPKEDRICIDKGDLPSRRVKRWTQIDCL